MSSTSGLSSNTSNNSPSRNPMQLDASTRESIQAQNQARILAGVLGSKKDSFNAGGGMNPLKGLYSAAAATFLKNKQGRQDTNGSDEKKGPLETSVAAVKKLSTESTSSNESWQNTNSKVSGPASGGNYKKYQWTGQPGPTGSDKVETTQAATPTHETTISDVFDALSSVISSNGGKVVDQGGGVSSFEVLDLTGEITVDDDTIRGHVKNASGEYAFKVDKNGEAAIEVVKGDQGSVEVEQLKGLLNGSLEGVRRKEPAPAEDEPKVADPEPEPEAATPPPPPPPPPTAVTPEEQAALDQAAADKAAADKAAADKAAADKAAADKAAADAAAAAKAAAAKAAADAAAAAAAANNTGPYKNSAALLTAFTQQMAKLGGVVSNKNGDDISHMTVKGMSGTIEQRSDELRVKLDFGTGSVEVRINLNGEMSRFKTSGITLFKAGDLNTLKNSIGKLDRTGVNVVG